MHVAIDCFRVGQDLRPSLALCQQEKEYRSARKKLVKQALIDLMAKRNEGGGGPRVLREVCYISIVSIALPKKHPLCRDSP